MFFSVWGSLSIFAHNSIRVQQTNINFGDQVASATSNQIFAIQFECIETVFMTKQKSPKQILEWLFIAKNIAEGNVPCFSHLGQVTYKI